MGGNMNSSIDIALTLSIFFESLKVISLCSLVKSVSKNLKEFSSLFNVFSSSILYEI